MTSSEVEHANLWSREAQKTIKNRPKFFLVSAKSTGGANFCWAVAQVKVKHEIALSVTVHPEEGAQ